MMIFLFFPAKIGFDISCKLPPLGTSNLLGKIRRYYFKMLRDSFFFFFFFCPGDEMLNLAF